MSTSAPLTGMSTSAHPTGGALISASPTGTLTSVHLLESVSAHSPMLALLLKLQTEREKREALEHDVDILKSSIVQSAADYIVDSIVLSRHLLLHGPDMFQ